MPPVFRGASYIYHVLTVCYRVSSAGQQSYFPGRGNCDFQTGVVLLLCLQATAISKSGSVYGAFSSQSYFVIWKILMTSPLNKRKVIEFSYLIFSLHVNFPDIYITIVCLLLRRYWYCPVILSPFFLETHSANPIITKIIVIISLLCRYYVVMSFFTILTRCFYIYLYLAWCFLSSAGGRTVRLLPSRAHKMPQ